MKPYPYGSSVSLQLKHLRDNQHALRAFCSKYPNLHPWELDANKGQVFFPATAAEAVKQTFGAEGWTVAGLAFSKEVDGLRVFCFLPVQSKQPWEGA